jgi:hypothetical protein
LPVVSRPLSAISRLQKNPFDCHPEEPKAVLSETKEGSLQFVETATAGILRSAQNDKAQAFFRSLFGDYEQRTTDDGQRTSLIFFHDWRECW